MEYRIEPRDGGYEPQMLYPSGITGQLTWFPLAEDGYWAEPDAYSMGLIRKRSIMTREAAARAIAKARSINEPC